ncbi:hypothetical protein Q5P00_33700 (plasmid) [Bacillus thuringiensis]|nr:hypothetical protein Q5P00_33700 [Bacillus thuringiensis]
MRGDKIKYKLQVPDRAQKKSKIEERGKKKETGSSQKGHMTREADTRNADKSGKSKETRKKEKGRGRNERTHHRKKRSAARWKA